VGIGVGLLLAVGEDVGDFEGAEVIPENGSNGEGAGVKDAPDE
jgi:hypothetical protein